MFFGDGKFYVAQELAICRNVFAVRTVGRDEMFFFEESQRFLDGVWVDFGVESKLAYRGELFSGRKSAGNNRKLQLFS